VIPEQIQFYTSPAASIVFPCPSLFSRTLDENDESRFHFIRSKCLWPGYINTIIDSPDVNQRREFNRLFTCSGEVMFPVRYELGFYVPEDGILHRQYRENLKSYIALTGWAL
jgi:hypothetical protein